MTPFENEIDQLLTQAEALLQDEKPSEALTLLDRARKLEPKHAWMILFRGVALGQLGRVDEAVDQLITAADGNQEDVDIQVDAARHLSFLEQYQDALICAKRAVSLDEADAGAQGIYGEVLERMERIADAVPYREQALLLDPEDIDSRYYLAVDLCDLGRYAEATAIAEPLVLQFPDDPDIIRLHGACLSYQGHHEEALARWAELERYEGITPNLLHNRASTLDVLGQSEEALTTIDEAIDIEPDLAMNYYTRAMIKEHLQDDAGAVEDYLETLARDPGHLDAIINLVEIATTVDIIPAVLERVDHLLETTEDDAKLRYARGRLLMENGELTRGAEEIAAAVQREPAMGIAWYTLTMLYGMLADLEAAVSASDQALRHFPDDAGLWFHRGLALHDLRRFPEAMESYDRAIQLAPEDPIPWVQLGRLLLLDLERPKDARGVLREVLRLQPDNQSAPWMLGLCYLRLGQIDEAASILHTLLGGEPDHLWGRLVRAAFSAQHGDLDTAFDDLSVATVQGYDTRLLLNEPLFEPLWADTRFASMLSAAKDMPADEA
ncbi:MAG TPA: tetratricopeptide repeat protein [Armatimonadota bacterium]|jgi:superkiller protein 3